MLFAWFCLSTMYQKPSKIVLKSYRISFWNLYRQKIPKYLQNDPKTCPKPSKMGGVEPRKPTSWLNKPLKESPRRFVSSTWTQNGPKILPQELQNASKTTLQWFYAMIIMSLPLCYYNDAIIKTIIPEGDESCAAFPLSSLFLRLQKTKLWPNWRRSGC